MSGQQQASRGSGVKCLLSLPVWGQGGLGCPANLSLRPVAFAGYLQTPWWPPTRRACWEMGTTMWTSLWQHFRPKAMKLFGGTSAGNRTRLDLKGSGTQLERKPVVWLTAGESWGVGWRRGARLCFCSAGMSAPLLSHTLWASSWTCPPACAGVPWSCHSKGSTGSVFERWEVPTTTSTPNWRCLNGLEARASSGTCVAGVVASWTYFWVFDKASEIPSSVDPLPVV